MLLLYTLYALTVSALLYASVSSRLYKDRLYSRLSTVAYLMAAIAWCI
jgi:hypothetical protein